MLDPETGLDPPGVKLRAVQGIDAASSFIQGMYYFCHSHQMRPNDEGCHGFRILDMVYYYRFLTTRCTYCPQRSKIIQNLAAVGYDTNSLNLAAYDWRLSYYNLEVRDGYFSRLKTTIEGFKYDILSHRLGWIDPLSGRGKGVKLCLPRIPWEQPFVNLSH